METCHAWARLFELQRYYSWIVDCFHISTCACQLQTWTGLRFSLAGAASRSIGLSAGFYEPLSRILRRRARGAAQSALPKLEVDISDSDIPAAVEKIADWMEAAGGLYLND